MTIIIDVKKKISEIKNNFSYSSFYETKIRIALVFLSLFSVFGR